MKSFYRIADLATTREKDGLIGVSAPTLWRWIRDGHFPQPVKLGPNTTAFDAEAVNNWIQSRLVTVA